MTVGETGCVPQQILHRHPALHRFGFQCLYGCVIGIDRDLEIGKFRNVASDRIGDQQFAFLSQHHRGDRGEWLCHRSDAKDRVRRHLRAGFAITIAQSFQAGDFSMPRDQHDGAGNDASVDIGFQYPGQAFQARR
jgi:hypothetical protein